MECCIFIIIIVLVVLAITFAAAILTVLVGVLQVIYLLLLNLGDWLKRIFWKRSLAGLSYSDLENDFNELEKRLFGLEITENRLMRAITNRDAAKEINWGDLSYEVNRAKIDDVKARIAVVNGMLRNLQPFEDLEVAKRQSNRQARLEIFASTKDYRLIKQFARKGLASESTGSLNKLRILIKNRGFDMSDDELRDLLEKELQKQAIESAKDEILQSKPETKDEILRAFLNQFEPDDLGLLALDEILRERKLSSSDLAELQMDLDNVKQTIELEKFEEELLDEDQ